VTDPGVTLVRTTPPDPVTVAKALDRARGWVAILDADDRLEPDALARVADALTDPEVDLVYTDETTTVEGRGRMPFFKPGWSPDRLRCQPYLGRLVVLRAELVRRVGGLHTDFGPASEHDLLLRVAERARGVVHMPAALCHRGATSTLPYPAFPAAAIDGAVRAVDEHLERTGIGAVARRHATHDGLLRLEPRLREYPTVSIVIPTGGATRSVRGRPTTLVVNCVRSVLERSTYPVLEVVCVADRGTDAGTLEQLETLSGDGARVKIVDFDEPFHFSRKVNRGALAASGEILVFLNDDTEVRSPGWLEAMLLYALDPAIGAAGARLLFEDGMIQHAGVVGVGGNPGHPYHGCPADTTGYGANAVLPGDFLAVTGACLMTRRDVFLEVGGMSGWFPASYNDLDYCLKVRRAGYRVVATPDAVLDHFESSSRDGAVTGRELELVRRRWGRLLRDDPFYGPNFPSGIADYVPVSSP
jgi:GT2 family glycosyltransferase